jgi:hypothetical protein
MVKYYYHKEAFYYGKRKETCTQSTNDRRKT